MQMIMLLSLTSTNPPEISITPSEPSAEVYFTTPSSSYEIMGA